jgi:hypothetical protein
MLIGALVCKFGLIRVLDRRTMNRTPPSLAFGPLAAVVCTHLRKRERERAALCG